jgi:CubicO group peptidase (beta-lactamase class C family)
MVTNAVARTLASLPFALSLLALVGCRDQGTASSTCPEPTRDAAAGAPAVASSDALADVDARVQSIMERLDVPGLSVAVVKDGKVVLAQGYGVRERGKPGAIDEHTTFAIASNTKAFLATIVAQLVHEKKLDWDDPALKHLPKLKLWDEHATKDIRVRDLLSHRSGLDTWAGDTAWIGSKIDTAGMMAALQHVTPGAGLRSRYGYTNLMFMVAGEVIRAVTGKSWEQEVRERILEPAGMKRTTTSVSQLPKQDNVAAPHMPNPKNEEELIVIPYLNVDAAGASAALNSSAADMAQWLKLQLGNGTLDGAQLFDPKVVEALHQPHTPIRIPKDRLADGQHFVVYGLGWFMYDYHGRQVVTHGGGLPGMTSRVGLVPEEGLGVVVLTNSETSASAYLFMELMDAYLGVAPTDRIAKQEERKAEAEKKKQEAKSGAGKAEPAKPSFAPPKYAGTFRNPLLGRAHVTEKDGALSLDLPDHGGLKCPLVHKDADTFDCTWVDPIFGSSKVAFTARKTSVTSLSFRVRPEFIDPLKYEFKKSRARSLRASWRRESSTRPVRGRPRSSRRTSE